MYRIKNLSPIPVGLDPTSNIYLRVLRSNISTINGTTSNTASLDYSGYDKSENKGLIRNLAYGCCGYCGIRANGSNTVEVEHYRPKNELKIRKHEFILHKKSNYTISLTTKMASTFGYYRWGNHYMNLLPACGGCNRGVGNAGVYVDNTLKYNTPYGKRNNFPVRYKKIGGKRKEYRDNTKEIVNISSEIPLLFNPYLDNPRKLFSYKKPSKTSDGLIVKIRPNKKQNKTNKLKATISINLLGLNRQKLCTKRYVILSEYNNIKRNIARDIKNGNYRVNTWSRYAEEYASRNNPQTSDLTGYFFQISYKLGFLIHKTIRQHFPSESHGILTNTCNFSKVVKELRSFSNTHYDYDDDNNNVNDLLGF